jgi:flagellar basal-body rod protein FlgB
MMQLSEAPLLSLLRERMSWLNARQSVLSQNIANSDSPGYVARDLKPLDFESILQQSAQSQNFSGLSATNPRHIAIQTGAMDGFPDAASPDTEANPTGNTVSLEDEMIKVADTQGQYQAAANLYAKAIGMMRTAIGKSGS